MSIEETMTFSLLMQFFLSSWKNTCLKVQLNMLLSSTVELPYCRALLMPKITRKLYKAYSPQICATFPLKAFDNS